MSLYDRIGREYSLGRRTDPRIAACIHAELAGFRSLLNLGAGTGNYEPQDGRVVAVEPAAAMIAQRSRHSAPVVQAQCEALPFADGSFSHALTVLSMHHWQDRARAFEQISRVVTDRLVLVTWDPEAAPFWLTRDYFPEVIDIDRAIFPPLGELAAAFGAIDVKPLPIPADCVDGFTGAYWQRPHAYLDPLVRANMSTFACIAGEASGVAALQRDLDCGAWRQRNGDLLHATQLDIGYRIVVVDLC